VTPAARRGLLRGGAVLLALALHAAVLLPALWPRDRVPPLVIQAVPVTLSGAVGEEEAGTGAAPAPAAETPPQPKPPQAALPDAAADLVQPVPPEAVASVAPPMPEPQSEPEPAAPDQPPAPAAIPLPLPPPPAPEPAVQAAVAQPAPQAPARVPSQTMAQASAQAPVRLGAGMAVAMAPGPETRAARARDVACSDATDYPSELRQAGIGGDVALRLRLTDKGRVIEARVVESSGYPQLDEAVRLGVRRCRFDPALRDGVPVWSNLTWRVTFRPF
jgi:protein TonB